MESRSHTHPPALSSLEWETLRRVVAPPAETAAAAPCDSSNTDALIDLAKRHRCLPLLAVQMTKAGAADPRLARVGMATAVANTRAVACLRRIQELQRAHGIRSVCLKGPALAQQAYGSIDLRFFQDLDLLVCPDQVLRNHEVLTEGGCAPLRPHGTACLNAYVRTQQDFLYQDRDARIVIDVKPVVISHAIASLRVTERFLEAAVDVRCGEGLVIRAPCPEHMLLVACMHGVHDGWPTLSAVADVAHLAVSGGLNWEYVLREAAAFRQERSLRIGLVLAEVLLEIVLPGSVKRYIREDRVAAKLSRAALSRFTQPSPSLTPTAVWRYERLSRDTFGDRLRCGWRQCVVPSAEDLRHYPLPASLWFLYGILRPMRLAFGRVSRNRRGRNG